MGSAKDNLDGQFILAQDSSFIPDSWKKQELSPWVLGTHPSLRVTGILSDDGANVGWLLGYPITPDCEFCPAHPVFPLNRNQNKRDAVIESRLYEMGGRFVAVFLSEKFSRLYLDPTGSLSVVYSTEVPVVASTPSLIDRSPHEWDTELIKTLKMPDSGLWYPSGLTPRNFVSRLLPNHFLDLSLWKPVRHWPVQTSFEADGNPAQKVEQIIKIVINHVSAVAQKYLLHLSLTAGRDTRMLLACARKNLDRIQFFTFASQEENVDSHIAGLISSKLNLDHRFLQIEYANQRQLDTWFHRTGHCVSGDISKIHQTQRHLDAKRAIMPGLAAEVSKLINYREEDTKESPLDAKELLNRSKIPPHEKLLSITENWLSEINQFNTFRKLDLWHIEQRLGCWAGPQAYGADNYTVCHLLPFSHRKVFELMLTLPFDYRKKRQLTIDICRREWPELLDFPFNEFTGVRKYGRKIGWRLKRVFKRMHSARQ